MQSREVSDDGGDGRPSIALPANLRIYSQQQQLAIAVRAHSAPVQSSPSRSMKLRPKHLLATLAILASCNLSSANILNSKYEDMRSDAAASVERKGSVDLIISPDDEKLGICHIPFFAGFSVGKKAQTSHVLEGSIASHLAIQHLNDGNGSVIPELSGLPDRCPIRFTTEMFDTELIENVVVQETIELLSREPGLDLYPCAIIGSYRSSISIPQALLTSVSGVPQISPASTDQRLDDQAQFKYFGRVVPSSDGMTRPAMQYICETLGARHLAVIYQNDYFGNAYVSGLQKAATEYCPEMKIQLSDISFSGEDLKKAVLTLKNTAFRYFYGVIYGENNFVPLMKEAHRQGIAGTGEHVWFFADVVTLGTKDIKAEEGSPLHLAAQGIGIFNRSPGSGLTYDRFFEAWQGLNNPRDIAYMQTRHAHYNDPGYAMQPIDDKVFEKGQLNIAAFVYDSCIAIGLAACNSTLSDTYFDGPSLYEAFLRSNFEGATGTVTIDAATGTRVPTSVNFDLINYVEKSVVNGTVNLAPVISDAFRKGQWETLTPYVFNDGSTRKLPDLPRITIDYHYIGKGLRAAGLAMSAAIILSSILFAVWTTVNRRSKVVRAAQPIFLDVICFGTLLMGSTIIPLSIDDEIASPRGCSIACMASPWLLAIGFTLVFAALFSKTWRTNRIFLSGMKKVTVTVADVSRPLLAILAANVLVLGLWTGLAPLVWERTISNKDRFSRTVETLGRCTSDGYIPYVVVLVLINLGALTLTMYQTYLSREISTEFAESRYIALSTATVLLVAFVGVPGIFLASEEPKANFFTMACIIFVICVSLLLLIFVPKINFLLRRDTNTGSFGRESLRTYVKKASHYIQASDNSLHNVRTVFDSTHNSSSRNQDNTGTRIINHPKLLEEMKQECSALRTENSALYKQNEELATRIKELEGTYSERGSSTHDHQGQVTSPTQVAECFRREEKEEEV